MNEFESSRGNTEDEPFESFFPRSFYDPRDPRRDALYVRSLEMQCSVLFDVSVAGVAAGGLPFAHMVLQCFT